MLNLVVVGLAVVLGLWACVAWFVPSGAAQHDERPRPRHLLPAILTLNEALPHTDIAESAGVLTNATRMRHPYTT